MIVNSPGSFSAQGAFAAGRYCRAFASSPAVPGTQAAIAAEWTSAAPGQVRSWTVRNIPYFRAAAARALADSQMVALNPSDVTPEEGSRETMPKPSGKTSKSNRFWKSIFAAA